MTLREQILQQALTLSPTDQAYVAHALENHLHQLQSAESDEAETDCDPLLLEELRRRMAAYRAGTTTARDASEVMRDLRQRQANESKP